MAKNEEEIRNLLTDSAAYVIAIEGEYRATTKRIARHANVNEAYIYRYFDSKKDLIAHAFAQNDTNLAILIKKNLKMMKNEELAWKTRCRNLFMSSWKLMISIDYQAIFYIRYYYSAQYPICSKHNHEVCYYSSIEELKSFFRPEANATDLLKFVFESTLAMVFRAVSSTSEVTDDDVEQQFNLVFQAISPSFCEGLFIE